jgi:hypothetical protein
MPVSFTPTPTPSVSPTISLTPSISPTITPSITSCPYTCCFPSGFTNPVNSFISSMFLLDDGSFLMRTNNLDWNNATLNTLSRFDNCGNLLNNYTFGPITSGILTTGYGRQSDGKVIVGMNSRLVRLDTNYNLDTTFVSGTPIGNIFGLAVNSQDEIFITGNFTGYTTTAGTITYNQNVYKLNKDGIPDPTWSGKTISYTGPFGEPFDGNVIKDYDGKIIIFSNTATFGNSSYQGVVRLNDDFSLDTTFLAAGFTGTNGRLVNTVQPLTDGKYLVGGSFQNYSGFTTQDNLIRLNTDGTLDTTFNFQDTVVNQFVQDVVVQSSGRIIVADRFANVNGYLPNGSFDPTFVSANTTSTTANFETTLMLFPNDYIMVGGAFITYAGTAYPKLVKLDEDGNLNMCPFPSATPTNTPTMTQTPSQTATPILSPTTTPTITPTPTFTYYFYAGTVSTYATDTDACTNKTCGRPYYKSVPSWAMGTTVYDDSSLTTPFNGGGNWIAVDTSTGTYCSGSAWAAIQVNAGGIIIGFVSCP